METPASLPLSGASGAELVLSPLDEIITAGAAPCRDLITHQLFIRFIFLTVETIENELINRQAHVTTKRERREDRGERREDSKGASAA